MGRGVKPQESNGVWSKEQTYHGGQTWNHLAKFVEDFSVTTNCCGTPEDALNASVNCLRKTIQHYPAADGQPTKTDLAHWLWPDSTHEHERVVLGNGASELIDLVMRDAVANGCTRGCKTGPHSVQYKEYERAYRGTGYRILDHDECLTENGVCCLVNPNNPTGDYLSVEDLKQHIFDTVRDKCSVLVDESMQMWVGPHWREDSLVSQTEWIKEMKQTRGISIWIIHSWTKIWCCPGVRIGSVIAPTVEDARSIVGKQVPWSVNVAALAFLSAVVKDGEYMERTWKVTAPWRAHTFLLIQKHFPDWKVYGKGFLSWLWVDTGSENTASRVVFLAQEAGMPVRWGKLGYNHPTYIRLAVRAPDVTDQLFSILAHTNDVAA